MSEPEKNGKAPPGPAESPTAGRRPGRPSKSEGSQINRAAILKLGYRLAKTEDLQNISMVLVAKEMGVTTPLIHYYIKSRDHLTSGIMNLFFRDMMKRFPAPTGLWESDLTQAAWTMYRHYVDYAGIAAYTLLNNQFRIFQLTEPGEEDYGATTLEHFTTLVLRSGCTAERAGTYSHMLREFIVSSAHAATSARYPSQQKVFLQQKVATLEPDLYPSIHATVGTQVTLDAEGAFREGCHLFLMGLKDNRLQLAAMAAELPRRSPPTRAARKAAGAKNN